MKFIIFQWFLGASMAGIPHLAIHTGTKNRHIAVILTHIRVTIDIIIIIAAVTTFFYLFITIKKATQGNYTEENGRNGIFKVWKKLKIPISMVATFIIFNTSATICLSYTYYTGRSLIVVVAVLNICGWCSDVLIYVFLQRRVRSLLTSFCKRVKRSLVRDVHMDDVCSSNQMVMRVICDKSSELFFVNSEMS